MHERPSLVRVHGLCKGGHVEASLPNDAVDPSVRVVPDMGCRQVRHPPEVRGDCPVTLTGVSMTNGAVHVVEPLALFKGIRRGRDRIGYVARAESISPLRVIDGERILDWSSWILVGHDDRSREHIPHERGLRPCGCSRENKKHRHGQ